MDRETLAKAALLTVALITGSLLGIVEKQLGPEFVAPMGFTCLLVAASVLCRSIGWPWF